MAKNTTVAENGIQGSFAPVTEHSPAECPANSIHLSLQGKGGVGKSLIASILAQYFTDRRNALVSWVPTMIATGGRKLRAAWSTESNRAASPSALNILTV